MQEAVDLNNQDVDFDLTAQFYKYRTPYAGAFFRVLKERLNLSDQTHVLDIASGSGELSVGVSPYVGKVVGVDSSREMLSRAAPSPNVQYQFHDFQIGPFFPNMKFDCVLIGRAIPYLPIAALGPTLDHVLSHDGKVVICGSGFHQSTPWLEDYGLLKDKYRSYLPRRGQFNGIEKMASLNYRLADSFIVTADMTCTLDYIYKNILSFQSCTQKILANQDDFKRDLLGYLRPYVRDGHLTGRLATWANLFTR